MVHGPRVFRISIVVRPSVAAKGALCNQECNAEQTAARHVGYALRGILLPWKRHNKTLDFREDDCNGCRGYSCNTEQASTHVYNKKSMVVNNQKRVDGSEARTEAPLFIIIKEVHP